jgi:hypothetical protein
MGQLVDELEELCYVERRPDPVDRRAKRIHLTRKGKRRSRWSGKLLAKWTVLWKLFSEKSDTRISGGHLRRSWKRPVSLLRHKRVWMGRGQVSFCERGCLPCMFVRCSKPVSLLAHRRHLKNSCGRRGRAAARLTMLSGAPDPYRSVRYASSRSTSSLGRLRATQ